MTNANSAIHALADPTRLEIFKRLSKRPMAVVDIADGLAVSRPAVSQHLKVLKDAGLISVTASGTRHLYRIDPKGIQKMRSTLDRLWDQALVSFQNLTEEESEE
jgi:DNA-binding transcriptional ArsR family regulator